MRKLFSLAVLLLSATASASAQTTLGNLTFQGDVSANGVVKYGKNRPNASYNSYSVGPYKADLAFAPTLSSTNTAIWCVDFSHVAPSIGSMDSYVASVVGGTDASATRMGSFGKYQQAAWLIEQHYAGVAGYTAQNVQGTIWQIFGVAPATYNTVGIYGYTDLTQDALFKSSNYALANNWFVLSDKQDCWQQAYQTGSGRRRTTAYKTVCETESNQEFLTYTVRQTPPPPPPPPPPPVVSTVPEPSTYALMGAGLIAMGLVARRRRR